MERLIEISEIEAAADDLRKAVDRLVDLGLYWEPLRALDAIDSLVNIRYLVANAVMAAFPRAETPFHRDRLIHVLDAMSPPEHDASQAFLQRVAAEDPDKDVRIYAEEVYDKLKELEELEPAFW
jgi:hypothetical protein